VLLQRRRRFFKQLNEPLEVIRRDFHDNSELAHCCLPTGYKQPHPTLVFCWFPINSSTRGWASQASSVFGWRDVAEIAVDALRVEPMHPSQRGELNVGDGAPWSLVGSVDQLGFVEAVRRFRQGVIERLSG
jgi:hypothetical protein